MAIHVIRKAVEDILVVESFDPHGINKYYKGTAKYNAVTAYQFLNVDNPVYQMWCSIIEIDHKRFHKLLCSILKARKRIGRHYRKARYKSENKDNECSVVNVDI